MISRPEVTGRSAHQGVSSDDDKVMSFIEWCDLNGFSRSTGQRVIASGKGPRFIQLSEKRKGVTVGENRRWQESRLIETAA
jgi:predicted DNA-binding transcriptional regulator AlpA